ncbi:pyridoxal-dependent decarboxylase, exosortase A system-associated [Parerythrobacter aestuarii]|uniref:pyridoxal-dependent decarboxylase, exosortase A system-associated n=1 Tax=Parerythrobacter aestuarii TaxID=3020909 RepID=UPI0024DE6CF8|nr:pyridoxal-dependent decarboxylase, exosortase A system-associated [Parerythrobacter aestuarii]
MSAAEKPPGKPLGPLPQGYETFNGQLAIGGQTAAQLVQQAGGTPLFVYSREIIANTMMRLREAMPARLHINYAIKANSHPDVLSYMADLVDGFDIASGGELEKIQASGIDASRVSFAGPGKRDWELEAAIRASVTLNLESESEAERALAIGNQLGITPRLAIRVNPDFDMKGSGMKMGGGAKPFGVDAERVPELGRKIIAAGAEWRGLHIYTGSQALSAEAIIETQANVLELADRIATDTGHPLPKLNMGGGYGIPYFHGDEPLDIEAIGAALEERFGDLPASLKDSHLCIELGRYLVGLAGVYLCRVVDRKVSHGETFLVTDGGLHHQLAASGNFGTVVRRNYPAAIATRFDAPPEEVQHIVGCLCTPLDKLSDKGFLPRAEVDDIVAIFCAGAYGASASPAQFLGQGPAQEVLV